MAKSVGRPKQGEETKERTTIFINPSLIYKLDYISSELFKKRSKKVSRAELINEALEDYVTKFEKKNGEISVK